MKKLSHINNKGEANMVDIQDKKSSKRVAIAEGSITLSKKALNQINDDKVSKGNVINTARIAGIMGAKKTSDLIPLCHPIPIEAIKIDFSINEKDINVLATVSTTNKTGVEMEALVAVNIACLIVFRVNSKSNLFPDLSMPVFTKKKLPTDRRDFHGKLVRK